MVLHFQKKEKTKKKRALSLLPSASPRFSEHDALDGLYALCGESQGQKRSRGRGNGSSSSLFDIDAVVVGHAFIIIISASRSHLSCAFSCALTPRQDSSWSFLVAGTVEVSIEGRKKRENHTGCDQNS